MFRISLRLGAIIGNATPEQLAALDKYGQNLGLAFQIVDDLLDVQGETQDLGKTAGKDRAQGKLTYPGLLGAEASRQRAAALLEEARTAVTLFGSRAAHLIALTHYVLDRKR
jgi:geranylgeranyl pyrophosphate synthase